MLRRSEISCTQKLHGKAIEGVKTLPPKGFCNQEKRTAGPENAVDLS